MPHNANTAREFWCHGATNIMTSKGDWCHYTDANDNMPFCCNEILRLKQEKNKILLNLLLMFSVLFFDFLKIKNKILKLESEIKLYEEIVELYKWYYSNGYKL